MAASQNKGHGTVSRRVPVEGLAQGQAEFLRAIVIEEAEQLWSENGQRIPRT